MFSDPPTVLVMLHLLLVEAMWILSKRKSAEIFVPAKSVRVHIRRMLAVLDCAISYHSCLSRDKLKVAISLWINDLKSPIPTRTAESRRTMQSSRGNDSVIIWETSG